MRVRVPPSAPFLPVDLTEVVFAHGSGSSRHSTRNKYVAQVIQNAGSVHFFSISSPGKRILLTAGVYKKAFSMEGKLYFEIRENSFLKAGF